MSEQMLREVPITDIKVCKRHRRNLGDIESLAESIRAVGLIHPIVVDGDLSLLAGRRRLEAVKELKWTSVPVVILEGSHEPG